MYTHITRCLSSLLSVLIGAAKSADLRGAPGFFMETFVILIFAEAAIAQLGERQTEDLKVPGSILGLGRCYARSGGHRPLQRALWLLQGALRGNVFMPVRPAASCATNSAVRSPQLPWQDAAV